MSNRQRYIDQLKAKLDEWNADIDQMEVQANLAKADIKDDVQEKIAELKVKRQEMRDHLDHLANAGDDAWEDIKAGADRTWDTLSDTLKSVIARFK